MKLAGGISRHLLTGAGKAAGSITSLVEGFIWVLSRLKLELCRKPMTS